MKFSITFIQSQFTRMLFDFCFKQLLNKRLAFPTLYRDCYILLLATSKHHWLPSIIFAL